MQEALHGQHLIFGRLHPNGGGSNRETKYSQMNGNPFQLRHLASLATHVRMAAGEGEEGGAAHGCGHFVKNIKNSF